jgi:microcystin-dependent protein
MALITTLAACSTNEALNGPAGTDLPSTLDDQIRYALRFIAELRDGMAIPAGQVAAFVTQTAPSGWLKLNGGMYSRTTYARLWAFAAGAGNICTEAQWSSGYFGLFTTGDGASSFRVPDFRGVFLRGLDEGRGLDISRAMGLYQDHANVFHDHALYDPGHAHAVYDPGHVHSGVTDIQGSHSHTYVAPTATAAATNDTGGGTGIYGIVSGDTGAVGGHNHNVSVGANATGIGIYAAGTGQLVSGSGGNDGHPRNTSAPYYIKY